jgi:arylsulfatase A-like enzyme
MPIDFRPNRLAVLLLALSCLHGCADAREPNLLLIPLDTVRADHFSSYGYKRPTTPELDAFASRATRYETCFSTASWTVPSHASLFTGLHPFEHGAHSFEPRDSKGSNVSPLDDSHETLAEVLRTEGYVTAGIVANKAYLKPRLNLQQGFDHWDVKRTRAAGVNRRVFRWLADRDDRPFFLFVNYLDAHYPYNAAPIAGERVYEGHERPAAALDRLIRRVMVDGEAPGELGELVVEQYDRAIRNLDEQLGRLLERLEELGLYDDTLIVITSDHGEYFGEHGLVQHSKDVYQPALEVPLIVKWPGQTRGEVVTGPISLVDLPRMILSGISPALLERYAEHFRYEPGNHPIIAENYFSRPKDLFHPVYGDRFRRVRTALLGDKHKFIHSSDGNHELYHLESDRDETRNLVAELPDRAREMSETLRELQQTGRWSAPVENGGALSAEEIEELKAMGYIADDDDAGS